MMFKEERFEDVLKSLRVRQGKMWTQARTAQSLGVSLRTYVRWENGESLPESRDLKNIAATFQLSETEDETLFRAAGSVSPHIQNLPFPPNPFFTGRGNELLLISQLFEQNERIALTQPIGIGGLGGIGKTQLALEYAHRCYPGIYRSVFFVNAADKATLEAGYLSLAHLLRLPEKNEREIDRIVQTVKIWLEEHTRWLLILDNADDLSLTRSYLPTRPRGHILLTTRSQIVGNMAALLPVEAMSPEVGLLFLLKRSGLLKSGSELSTIASDIHREALALVEMLGGHPLALDQAGAYIEETRSSLTQYRQLYQQERHHLLKSRGTLGDEHPESVVLTLEISVQKACELHPGCGDILSFCSLLHPDAIPEELLYQETALDLPPLHFDEAVVALRRYSLVKRDAEKKVLSVHRLVQAVSRDAMESQTLRQWAERVVRAVNEAFPEAKFEDWERCERYLPHALFSENWIEHEAVPQLQASYLLEKAGTYLQERGQYQDAEPLLVRALGVREQYLGAKHPDTAKSLHNLALLYRDQGKYEQAEPLLQRALCIREQHLGAEHPNTALSLNSLANLYWHQGKYEQAGPLLQRALRIQEQHLGAEHPNMAPSLNNLAILYWHQGKYEQAEPLFQRALVIREQHMGAEHPDTAKSLNNLALLYRQQGKYKQAELLFQRALVIREQHLGTEHPETAKSLNNLAFLYMRQGKYEQAEPLCRQALSIFEQHSGASHPETAKSLDDLAFLYLRQGKYEQAEPLFLRALSIQEQHLGTEHPETAVCLSNLAELYRLQGKYEQAEPLFLRAVAIKEQHMGIEHPETAESLYRLAQLYQQQGKYEQAEPLFQRALHIQEQRLGSAHPETESTRLAYAAFLRLVCRSESATMPDAGDKPSTEGDHE